MELPRDALIMRRDDGHLTNPVGEETVLLDLKTGDYLGLDTVASSIWGHLQTPQTVSSLLSKLMQEFDVEEAVCHSDTLEFLQRIDSLGLIQRLS